MPLDAGDVIARAMNAAAERADELHVHLTLHLNADGSVSPAQGGTEPSRDAPGTSDGSSGAPKDIEALAGDVADGVSRFIPRSTFDVGPSRYSENQLIVQKLDYIDAWEDVTAWLNDRFDRENVDWNGDQAYWKIDLGDA